MKKLLIVLIMIGFLSCEKSNKIQTKFIYGKWISQSECGTIYLTKDNCKIKNGFLFFEDLKVRIINVNENTLALDYECLIWKKPKVLTPSLISLGYILDDNGNIIQDTIN